MCCSTVQCERACGEYRIVQSSVSSTWRSVGLVRVVDGRRRGPVAVAAEGPGVVVVVVVVVEGGGVGPVCALRY